MCENEELQAVARRRASLQSTGDLRCRCREELLAQAGQAFPEEAAAFRALSQPPPAPQEPGQAPQGAGHSTEGPGAATPMSS